MTNTERSDTPEERRVYDDRMSYETWVLPSYTARERSIYEDGLKFGEQRSETPTSRPASEHVEDVYLAVRIAAEGSDWKRDSGETLAAWVDRTLRPSARICVVAATWVSADERLPELKPKGKTYVWIHRLDEKLFAGAQVVRWTGKEFKDLEDDTPVHPSHWMTIPPLPYERPSEK